MGELAPVLEIDGRTITTGDPGPMTARLRDLLLAHTREEGEDLPPS
jgi:branched-subunit amino acid aminotransferase/4-amino-4-deoxychorismate lyase